MRQSFWAAAVVLTGGLGTASAAPLLRNIVVDASGGHGALYTEIQPAIDAASHGDVIVVHPGSYEPFVLDDGLTVMGAANCFSPSFGACALIEAGSVVEGILGSRVAVLSNLQFEDLSINGNAGTVILSDIQLAHDGSGLLDVVDSEDVRIHRSSLNELGPSPSPATGAALSALNSRVEVVGCTITGGPGADASYGSSSPAGDGQPGIRAAGTRVHVVGSNVFGGAGGASDCRTGPGATLPPGAGGPGIVVDAGQVILAGRTGDLVQGGAEGFVPATCRGTAPDGPGVRIEALGTFRESNVQIECPPGTSTPPCTAIDNQGGVLLHPVVADPTLELIGAPTRGSIVRIVVHGPPGASAQLWFSHTPIVGQTTGTEIERLTRFFVGIPLQDLSASGARSFPWTVPPSYPAILPIRSLPGIGLLNSPIPSNLGRGKVLYVQAAVSNGGPPLLTNSIPVVLR